MKTSILFLLLCFFAHGWAAPQNDSLPEVPWKAIVGMTEGSNFFQWDTNINIKLFGKYTQADSLMVDSAIKTMNGLSETVKLSMTTLDRGNLEIFFVDSTNEAVYRPIFTCPLNYDSGYSYNGYNAADSSIITPMAHAKLYYRLSLVPDSAKQNFITNKLAYMFFPNLLNISKYFTKEGYNGPASIFTIYNPKVLAPFYRPLSDFDKQIFKTAYSKHFEQLLPLAKKQYGKIEFPKLLVRNSFALLIFPFVLCVLLMTWAFIVLYRKFFARIKNRLLQFNAISIVGLLFFGLLITLYLTTSMRIKQTTDYQYEVMSFGVGVLITIILGLPALNIIRFIELAIHKKTQYKYAKTLMLFLSTSLIPSATLSAIAYFGFKKDINDEGIRALIYMFVVFIVIATIRALISFFILKEKEIKMENDVKLANLRELKTKAELNALHSKINPHFLYNSLNSIAGLAKTDADKTEHMALLLSKLFRYAINKEQSDWSTLAEELEMVTIYLEIEKVRFDDRLAFTIDLPDDLRDTRIPRFMIQPLVENAIKHGISQLVTQGEVGISIRKTDPGMEISVSDNGPDFPNELNTGFGLQGIYDKLEILYPNRFELRFFNSPNKQIVIKLW